MGLFGPKLEWEEPWSWAKVKRCAKEIHAGFPPMWRMFLYCAVLPVIVLLAAFSCVRHISPDEPMLERANQLLTLKKESCFDNYNKSCFDFTPTSVK